MIKFNAIRGGINFSEDQNVPPFIKIIVNNIAENIQQIVIICCTKTSTLGFREAVAMTVNANTAKPQEKLVIVSRISRFMTIAKRHIIQNNWYNLPPYSSDSKFSL